MTTDAAQTETPEAQPQYITQDDFRRFQSIADRRVQEEKSLADEAFSRVAELEEQIQRLQERSIEDDDPRYVAAIKERNAAEKRAREAEALVKRFSSPYKRRLVEAESLKLARGDEALAEQLAPVLARGTTEQQVLQIAADLRARGLVPGSVPHPRQAPEVDSGRGSGRGGTPRVTQAWVESLSDEDYETHRSRILAAQKEHGGVLPAR